MNRSHSNFAKDQSPFALSSVKPKTEDASTTANPLLKKFNFGNPLSSQSSDKGLDLLSMGS